MELDSIIAAITKAVTALGIVGVGSYQLFKHFGAKWLDERFAHKAAALKSAQERSLAELKAEQDRSLRMVQSYIDREIHRARKLYDREFDVLSEAWRLLVRGFNSGVGTAAEMYPDLARYTEQELARFVEEVQMKHWEIDELRARESAERTAYYRRWTGFKRLSTYMKEHQEFQEFLLSSGIFMPEGLKARFTALQDMIGSCFAEFQVRLQDATFLEFAGVTKLTIEGRGLLNELEQLLHARLWSASEISGPDPASAA